MGELRIFPRHESADDVYLVGGAWAPACITAVEKRFTDAELAAEYWRLRDMKARGRVCSEWQAAHDELDTMQRFMELPHHDQETE